MTTIIVIWDGGNTMRRIIKKLYFNFRIRLRLLRLHFMRLDEPEDAKDPEEMLREIKKALNLT